MVARQLLMLATGDRVGITAELWDVEAGDRARATVAEMSRAQRDPLSSPVSLPATVPSSPTRWCHIDLVPSPEPITG